MIVIQITLIPTIFSTTRSEAICSCPAHPVARMNLNHCNIIDCLRLSNPFFLQEYLKFVHYDKPDPNGMTGAFQEDSATEKGARHLIPLCNVAR